VDANLPGGIFEKTPYLGFSVSMSGTCVFPFCRKCDTATENTTEAEMTAGNHLGKALRWLHLFMDDLGLTFDGPILLPLRTMQRPVSLLPLANSHPM
jgi:hypothetical protein